MTVNPNHWSWNCVVVCFVWFSRWPWLAIGPEILVFLCFLVFSMVSATHGSWNVCFLICWGFLYGFAYPNGLHTCIALVFLMVLQITFAIKVVSSCTPYTLSFPSCLHTWAPLVFICFTNDFCFHIGFQLRSCMHPWTPACTEEPSSWMMFSPPREHVFQNKCPRADENTVSNSGDLCELQMVLSPRHHFNVWMWTHRSQNDALACTRTHVVQYMCCSKGSPSIVRELLL